LKSTDGGATWQAARTGIPDAYPAAMALASTAPGTVYAGVATVFPAIPGTEVGAVFVSHDGGATWGPTAAVGPMVRRFALDPRLPGLLYASTDHGVFRSVDGGSRWGPIDDGLPSLSLVDLAVVAAPGRPLRLVATLPGTGALVRPEEPTLRLTPPSGRYAPSQRFDLGLVLESASPVIGGAAPTARRRGA